MTDYFPTIQGFAHSSEKHRSKYLGPLHPCKRFGMPATLQIAYLNALGLHSQSTPPPWKRQPLSQLSPVPGNSPAQSSHQLPLPLWGMQHLPAHLLHQWRQECDSHLHPTDMGFGQEQLWEGTGELWTLESIFQRFPSRLLVDWDLLKISFLVRLFAQVLLPFIHF